MSYSDFSLESVVEKFSLVVEEKTPLFPDVKAMEASSLLKQLLVRHLPLALSINTEKARSEFIIAPVLAELRERLEKKVSLFSGVDFNVDSSLGLSGVCDYLVSHSPNQLTVESPIAVLVEAKKENLNGGLGQCIAEMIAAQLFNQHKASSSLSVQQVINGVVTSGSAWKFLSLSGRKVTIDPLERYISQIDEILGLLRASVGE